MALDVVETAASAPSFFRTKAAVDTSYKPKKAPTTLTKLTKVVQTARDLSVPEKTVGKAWRGASRAVAVRAEQDKDPMTMHEALKRLEFALNANVGDHSASAELKRVLGLISPLELGLTEPFSRFDAGVEAVASQLLHRDVDSDEQLALIRAAVSNALENGRFGPLPPLERDAAKQAAGKEAAGKVQMQWRHPGPSGAADELDAGGSAIIDQARAQRIEREGAEDTVRAPPRPFLEHSRAAHRGALKPAA